MKDIFFEGADFKNSEFKALIPEYYPDKYREYIKQETKLLKLVVKGNRRILEAGVGIGRLIPELAPLVKELVGIDDANLMINKSKTLAKNYKNVKIVKGNLEDLDKIFNKDYFDFSLCVWNTLGNVENQVKVLKELSYVTRKGIIVTVFLKGTTKDRKLWYKTLKIPINKIDKNETFYSKSGLKSRAYDLKDIEMLASKSNLLIERHKILNKVILFVEFVRS